MFNKAKYQYRLGDGGIKSSQAERRILGILLDEKSDINYHCALADLKAKCTKCSVPSRLGKVIFPF